MNSSNLFCSCLSVTCPSELRFTPFRIHTNKTCDLNLTHLLPLLSVHTFYTQYDNQMGQFQIYFNEISNFSHSEFAERTRTWQWNGDCMSAMEHSWSRKGLAMPFRGAQSHCSSFQVWAPDRSWLVPDCKMSLELAWEMRSVRKKLQCRANLWGLAVLWEYAK